MKKNWLRKVIGGLSFASVMFVFQACYGTPQDFGLDVLIEGKVTSKSSGQAIKGIKISVEDGSGQYSYTGENGEFSFYTHLSESYPLRFADVDSILNGQFAGKDTTIFNIENQVFLAIELDSE